MPEFVNLAPDIYRLRVPFSGTWTGVVLVRGTQNVLIDSAASASDVDNYIVPRAQKAGDVFVGYPILGLHPLPWQIMSGDMRASGSCAPPF